MNETSSSVAPRRLPSLSALRAFEAAARHSSFKQAAAELAVTPTAISHQVRALEDELGVRLFVRRVRSVALTAEGARLYPVLRDGLDAFARALDALATARARRIVTISATPAFTAKWLVPRVADFRAAHPDLDLRLHASMDPVDLKGGEADLAIRYGRGPYPGLHAETLFAETFAPTFHPRLSLRTGADVLAHPLLELEWRRVDRSTPTWDLWFQCAGLTRRAARATRIVFSDETHAIQAAIAGQGVALLGRALVQEELRAGSLVQPFGPVLDGLRHRLVHAKSAETNPAIVTVKAWLRDALRPSPMTSRLQRSSSRSPARRTR